MANLLLGITGGIASGKTTVANFLKQRGVPTIDFDELAREVVEPGNPALEQIAACFGQNVLQKDGTLDRKALSKIVFNHPEKRKQLESFTHPAIHDAFHMQVRAISENEPDAVIQVVVPLLIECSLRHIVDKIVLVYISPAEQIIRLARRDQISTDEAANILQAQFPIDEKRRYADFVINNQGTLEETEKQTDAMWQAVIRHAFYKFSDK